jgi:hypothetical protein
MSLFSAKDVEIQGSGEFANVSTALETFQPEFVVVVYDMGSRHRAAGSAGNFDGYAKVNRSFYLYFRRTHTLSHTLKRASQHACMHRYCHAYDEDYEREKNVLYKRKTTEIVCMQPATGNKEATKSRSGTLRPSSPPWRAVSCRQLPSSVGAHSSLRPTHATALPRILSLLMRCLSVCAPQPAFLKQRLAEGLLFELRHMKLRVKTRKMLTVADAIPG